MLKCLGRVGLLALFLSLVGGDCKSAGPPPIKLLKRVLRGEYVTLSADLSTSQYFRIPLDMWAPFRWEVKFGVVDPSRTAGLEGAIFGTELDERGTDPYRFFGLFGQLGGGGIQVWVSSGTVPGSGATNHGSTFYPDTVLVEGLVVADGANLRFLSRRAGTEDEHDLIATIPFAIQTAPLNPSIGAFMMEGDAELDFAGMRLPQNSPAPEPVSPAHQAVNEIFAAMMEVLDARFDVGAGELDTTSALADLKEAEALLADARASVLALDAAGKRTRTAAEQSVRQLDKAAKRLAKTVRKLEKRGDRAAKKTFKGTGKIILPLIVAADWVLPADLRESLPGSITTLR